MTRVSELQKEQEMVVVDSRKLLPFSFQFFGSFAAMFAEEVDSFDTIVADGPIERCIASIINYIHSSFFGD